jgi:D-alanyl-lipoteichoic acid acyltransferase DltB (MBOAT superfamily)
VNFNSFSYILLFLPIVFIACNLARRLPIPKAPQICILLASIVFYSWSKPSHLAYLLGSVVVNWQIAHLIGDAAQPRRKRYLQAGLVLNLGFLCTFKYANFFLSNIPYLVHHHFQAPDLAFPLGISFFTLSQIMYLVDCYEELMPPSSLFDHATFVSFFPYVISGPISRARRILHQFPSLNGAVGPDADTLARAMYLFTLGLIKKVVFADAFSKAADYGFGNIANLSTFEAWCFASAFALQMYFDFSGYSDMAIASAMFLGIEVPRNFDGPYRATSIIEFWQRWHITLTSFITTYIYTPLLQSFGRVTLATSAIVTLIAMTLAGLWHGPNWTFVIFGAIHGTGLAVNQYWRKKKMPRMPKPVGWLLTFALVDIAFVFFRSPNLRTAGLFLSRSFVGAKMFGTGNLLKMNGIGPMLVVLALSQVAGIVAVSCGKSSDQLSHEFKPTWSSYAATAAYALISVLYLNSNVAKPFLYFAF